MSSPAEVPRGWKRGFKIVTLCDDGKLRSMLAGTESEDNPAPVYSDVYVTRRRRNLEPFWVFIDQERLCKRLRAWPYSYEAWECVYRPAADRERWEEHLAIGDAASAVRLTIKLAERLTHNGAIGYEPGCCLPLD